MASSSRLTFASAWGFETTARTPEQVKELEQEFRKTGASECHGDYNKSDDVLVLQGRFESSLPRAAEILSRYIEQQESNDLLDIPRIYRLQVPEILKDDPMPVRSQDTNAQEGDLLALGPSPMRVTKAWASSEGGVGCFSCQFHDILSEISKLTGTEIAVSEDLKGIQVSGKNENDVDDALAKISNVQEPLKHICNPQVMNMAISPDNRLQMQYYTRLNSAAKRRILTDSDLSSTSSLYQSFVTVSIAFDSESQANRFPVNLLNPPRIGDGPGEESRVWNNFRFQEFGKGDQFNVVEVVETPRSEAKSSPVEVSPSHRYLSAAKALQVDQWVNERAEIDPVGPVPELASIPQPETQYEPTTATNTMKPPGIKSRRVVAPVQKLSSSSSKSTASHSKPLNAPVSDEKTNSPRKKWKMTYEINAGANASQTPGLGQPNKEINKREGAVLGYVASNIPAGKAELASDSDAPKNANNKPIRIPDNHRFKANETSSGSNRKPRKGSELIDTSVPACNANANVLPRLFMDQPALIPERSSGGNIPKNNSDNGAISYKANHSTDLAGLSFESDGSSPSPNSIPSSREVASSSTDISEPEERLERLKKTRTGQIGMKHINEVDVFTPHKPKSKRHANQVFSKERLEELDRIDRPEIMQSADDEVATRKYHLTMKQKTAKSFGKAKGKAEVKAKRQATLEDAWGLPKKPTKGAEGASGIEKVDGKPMKGARASGAKHEQLQANELRTNDNIKHLFSALKQTLEAAEYFPGTVTLELQFGLLLIPLLPKTYRENSMSVDEWTRIFQPQTGIAPPTTKFISRLTTSGSDVDHIVDLKTSKAEGKRRIFEQDASEYSVLYEYHCRTKSDKLIIMTVNEQGKNSLRYPTTVLGGVNLHFPGQTWDAHLGVSGGFTYREGSDPEIEKAIQHLADHCWVPPNQTLAQIFTKVPDGNTITIDKVLMKRLTRHRHIQAESNVNQDIFLQVTEVQDLIIGTCDTDSLVKRARCLSLLDMLKAGRQWYEVSLVSPAIEAILKANANIEFGERTDDWCATDLLGNDASLTHDKPAGSVETHAPISLSPVASAIGDAGIGNLFRVAKNIIGKMDGVGYWNYNPHADTDVMPPPSSLSIPPAATALTRASLRNFAVKSDTKSFSFEELESIKDVGCAAVDVVPTKKSSPIPSTKPMEQTEEVFW
ncbi:uncharacterized protein KD926_011730 [Aspergillus affinis]|uniref:uncharacterized protein n=1 Tax=Aspergillus affinis TaxID=1070780 RepID=UPI0022FDB763|nr:uncharacterized protein KD926_011730 [Aspergillus affinis]KAI9044759.1 hypothetical protein KD926_011730 [Aspergillus affinis]